MKKKVLRLVISGASVAELKENLIETLAELSSEETMTTTTRQSSEALIKEVLERIPANIDMSQVTQPVVEPAASIPSDFIVAPPMPSAATQLGEELHATVPNALGTDSMGLPWDERIHSASFVKTKSGAWRTRRNIEPSVIKQVEYELIAKLKGQQPQFTPPVPALPAEPVPQPVLNLVPPVMASPQSQPPVYTPPPLAPQPVAPPIPAPVAVTSAHTFQTFKAQLVPTLYALVEQGKLTVDYLTALKKHFKVTELWEANDAQINEMFEGFCTAGLLTKVN